MEIEIALAGAEYLAIRRIIEMMEMMIHVSFNMMMTCRYVLQLAFNMEEKVIRFAQAMHFDAEINAKRVSG
ncbi:hypothetical protein [Sphingorhabdus lutea]|nr:hypothetical protein [Sphingorhabdus lutea]